MRYTLTHIDMQGLGGKHVLPVQITDEGAILLRGMSAFMEPIGLIVGEGITVLEWEDASLFPERMNARGDVCGLYSDPERQAAFLYQGSEILLLPDLGDGASTAHFISESGHIVGSCSQQDEWSHAFFRHAGRSQLIPGLGGDYSHAYGVNNFGLVVGGAQSGRDGEYQDHAFLWDISNGLTSLHDPVHVASHAVRISNAGKVLICYGTDCVDSARIQDLGTGAITEIGCLAGHRFTIAQDMNENGLVVGHCTDKESSSGGRTVAFVYSNGAIHDLNELVETSWHINVAVSVNHAGEILVLGEKNGSHVPLLLRPIM